MPTLDPAICDKIRQSFAKQAMMDTLAAKLTSIAQGEVTIEAPIAAHTLQQHGFGHAGLTFSIGDSAAGYAALTMMALESEVLTAEIKINLLAPAKGQMLRATGRVLKPGRRLIVVSSTVHAIDQGQETLIAALQGTMVPVTL